MTDQTVVPEIDPAPEENDLDQVRKLILASHPDIVPELVQGESISELVTSIESAREAYARIAASVPSTVTVPAGGNAPVSFDISTLPTAEKIRRGLSIKRS